MPDTSKNKDQEAGDEVLRRMLKTPPKPHVEKPAKEDGEKVKQKVKDDAQWQSMKFVSQMTADVGRLREDVAFLTRVTRQLRDIAIAAHVAAR